MFWTIESYWPMTTWYKKCQMFYCCFSNSYVYYSCRYCMSKKCQIILRCFYNNFVYCPCQRSIFWQKDAQSLLETALFNEHYWCRRSISGIPCVPLLLFVRSGETGRTTNWNLLNVGSLFKDQSLSFARIRYIMIWYIMTTTLSGKKKEKTNLFTFNPIFL